MIEVPKSLSTFENGCDNVDMFGLPDNILLNPPLNVETTMLDLVLSGEEKVFPVNLNLSGQFIHIFTYPDNERMKLQWQIDLVDENYEKFKIADLDDLFFVRIVNALPLRITDPFGTNSSVTIHKGGKERKYVPSDETLRKAYFEETNGLKVESVESIFYSLTDNGKERITLNVVSTREGWYAALGISREIALRMPPDLLEVILQYYALEAELDEVVLAQDGANIVRQLAIRDFN